MKKEKSVKTYQRRTKSGKTITVKAHKASYDASMKADTAKSPRAKKNAGVEFEKRSAMPDAKLTAKEYLDELKKRREAMKKDKIEKQKKPVNGGITGLEPKKKKPTSKKTPEKSSPKSSSKRKELPTVGKSKSVKKQEVTSKKDYNFKETKRSPEIAALHYYRATGKQHPNGFKVKNTGKGFSVTPPADVRGKTNREANKLFDAYGNRKK